jgi:hypothetical protein
MAHRLLRRAALAGSNFDDKEKKTTGGRNGYGAKLANIFSTRPVLTLDYPTPHPSYAHVCICPSAPRWGVTRLRPSRSFASMRCLGAEPN